ncbi:MAG: DUF4115 domain-containing protein [Desulfuromonadaceae bacterium]|nr:DUF4115 domain-containing protein [Desulfuromonadaceae bacterium]
MNDSRSPDLVSESQENPGGSPGTILRRCREFHGITLEEAAETTKIGITHLKALEDDRIREFANQAYLKGFLRIYATYLGLNSEDVARMYDKLFGVKGEKADSARVAPASINPQRRWLSFKKLLFPAVLLAVILVTSTFYRRTPAPPVPPPPAAIVVSPPVQKAVVQTVQSSVRIRKTEQVVTPRSAEKVPVETPLPEKTVTAKSPVEGVRGLILKIKVSQNGTLTATVDGSGPQQYELTTGDIIEWKAENKITLDLSNAGGVDIELNGKPYQSLGSRGKQVYVEFNADSVNP